jgi:hypothetical protein
MTTGGEAGSGVLPWHEYPGDSGVLLLLTQINRYVLVMPVLRCVPTIAWLGRPTSGEDAVKLTRIACKRAAVALLRPKMVP